MQPDGFSALQLASEGRTCLLAPDWFCFHVAVIANPAGRM
jgi:hypothetical protein